MKIIDMQNWNRRKHYEFFKGMDYPHFNLTANVDISKLIPFIKEKNLTFFKTMLYITMKTANEIEAFRLRIVDGQVVEYESVHPSFTVMTENALFSFCYADFNTDAEVFFQNAQRSIDKLNNKPCLEDAPGRNDLIYVTSIPWVSFTGVAHPIHLTPVDSVPRIAWGKYFEEGGKFKLPVSVQMHHALADGVHVGKFFNLLQSYLDAPEKIFI